MNNELNIGTSEKGVIEISDVLVEHPDNKSESKSKTDKRLEKLNALKEKFEKAISAQECAEKKTQNISLQIEKIEKELHAEETAELDKACEIKKLSYREIARFLMSIPEDMTLTDIKNLIL